MNMTHEPMPRKDYEKEHWESLPKAKFHVYDHGKIRNNEVKEREFNKDQPTYVITHGFTANGKLNDNDAINDKDWVKNKAQAYRDENPDANIIVVDWEEAAALDQNAISNIQSDFIEGGIVGASIENDLIDVYKKAAHNTPEIGQQLGDKLIELGVNPNNTELIGHSLGAHVSGAAGARYYERTGEKINAITGLDPAGPGFQPNETLFEKYFLETDMVPHKLDSSDAEHVVAIHSSISFGYEPDLGDLDLHLNPDLPNAINPVTAHGYAIEFHTNLINKGYYEQPDGTIVDLASLKNKKGSFSVDTKTVGARYPINPEQLKTINFNNSCNKIRNFRRDRNKHSNEEKFNSMSDLISYDALLDYFKSN